MDESKIILNNMGNVQHKIDSSDMQINSFKHLNSIGKGHFGKVKIVQHKTTKKTYALKQFDKAELLKQKAIKNIICERNILQNISHTYICNLRYAFQDESRAYLIMDLMLGGDLRFHMSRRQFSEPEVKIISAQISLALHHLHKLGIIHRDIKPDNILLDEKGNAYISDFNVATYVGPIKKSNKTCGTTKYMAPEMKDQSCSQGYDFAVDWWSFGITLYEVLRNKLPIFDEDYLIKEESFVDAESVAYKEIIHALLQKDPKNRIGYYKSNNGYERLKMHDFYRDIDFEALNSKEVKPLFIPNCKKNYEMMHDLEDLLMSNKGKTPTSCSKSSTEENHKAQLILFERSFINYDYSKSMQNLCYNTSQEIKN